eukprot:863915-Pyramimonas_sp.AAC.1
MPRNTLPASRVPWASWVSMVPPRRARRSHSRSQWASWGLRDGSLVEGFLWTGPKSGMSFYTGGIPQYFKIVW